MRIILTLILFTFTSSLNADSPEADLRPALPFPPGVTLESQCGEVDDLQDVELYDGTLGVSQGYVKTHEASTVQFKWLGVREISEALPGYDTGNVGDVRWCSGTLISENMVLTAGHCFDISRDGWITPYKIDVNRRPQYATPEMLAPLFEVHFRYQVNGLTGGLRVPTVFRVSKLIEYRRGSLDYAIVELSKGNDGKWPGNLFPVADVETGIPREDAQLVILQHPQGKPKKVEAGEMLTSDANKLWYNDIDTHGGSSGAGIRNSLGKIVGVHTNGGCRANSGANLGYHNKAISAVSDHL